MQLDAVIARYAALRRYDDAGRVLEWDGAWVLARRFETSFVRDERFRLEVWMPEQGDASLVVEVVGRRVKVTRPAGWPPWRRRGLEAALSDHAGVTSAASWIVPYTLLFAFPHGQAWLRGAPESVELDASGLLRALEWSAEGRRQRFELEATTAV